MRRVSGCLLVWGWWTALLGNGAGSRPGGGEGAYLSYWRHGKLQRWCSHGLAELQLILIVEALVLGVGRPTVSCDEGIHRDVDRVLSLVSDVMFLVRRLAMERGKYSL